MLELVSFICGAAVMVLEMAGARVMAPYLGTSVIVWTALIGVILGALSLGYWLGGKYADKNPSAKKLGMIIGGGSLFVLIAAASQKTLLTAVASANLPLQISAIAAATLLFAVPAVFMGMVSPYIIQVRLLDYKGKNQTGSIIGRFYALSTVGSIFGTFLGGYWLISWCGTRTILYGISAVLAIAAAIVLPRSKKASALILLGHCVGFGIYADINTKEYLSTGINIDTRYNHLRIQEGYFGSGPKMRFLVTDPGSVQSGMYPDRPDELALDYTKHYALAWHIQPEAKQFLMLGGGGYSVPKYLLAHKAGAKVDVVEIDPGITRAAKDFFALRDNPSLRIFDEDARVFLNREAGTAPSGGLYDVIMGDTFSSSYNIPFHLATVECAERIKALLRDDGVFVCNIISGITGDQGQILRGIHASFAEVFPQTHVFQIHKESPADRTQNLMLVALKTPRSIPLAWDENTREMLAGEFRQPIPTDIAALTDNFAPVERYAMPMLQARN